MELIDVQAELNSVIELLRTLNLQLSTSTLNINKLSYENVDISNIYNEKSFWMIEKSINWLIKEINGYIKLLNQLSYVNVETGLSMTTLPKFSFNTLNLYQINVAIIDELGLVKQAIIDIQNTLDGFGLLSDVPLPTENPKLPDALVPFQNDVLNSGMVKKAEFPDTSFHTTQGAGFDDNYYYSLGRKSPTDMKLYLQVIGKDAKHPSFVATGNIGNHVVAGQSGPKNDYSKDTLGHANDCAVMYQNGSEVTLLVSSMEPNKVATCIVDLTKRTVRIGKRIPLFTKAEEQVSPYLTVTSVQNLHDGRVMLKANNYFWTAKYDESSMQLERFAQTSKTDWFNIVRQKLGNHFLETATTQSDWYQNGYLYGVLTGTGAHQSVIIELIPQGPDKPAIASNRLWWTSDTVRRTELEKIWFENNEMYGNFSMTNPYDNYIAKIDWKNSNDSIVAEDKSEYYDEITYQTNLYDANSKSYYNVIRVPHTDKNGNVIEIKQGLPNDRTFYGIDKQKPSDFYALHGNATVITAGTPRRGGANATPSGPVVGAPETPYVKPVAFMSDGTLRTFDRNMKVEQMIQQGAKSVFSGFWPLVENGRPAIHDEEAKDPVYGKLMEKNPRSIIAQLPDKTILLVTVMGRFKKCLGMTYDEMVAFCINTLHAEFAYNLDGGGSSHQIVRGEYLTPMYDTNRTEERSLGSFLYIQKNKQNVPGTLNKVYETLKAVTERSIANYD